MVYGTIIFEVETWEPSLTPPSSLSPTPLMPYTVREGEVPETTRQVA